MRRLCALQCGACGDKAEREAETVMTSCPACVEEEPRLLLLTVAASLTSSDFSTALRKRAVWSISSLLCAMIALTGDS